MDSFQENELFIKTTCNEFQKSIIDKNNSFLNEIVEQVYDSRIKLNINYDIQEVQPGQTTGNSPEKREEKLKKIETLKASDPLFKKFVDEFGLELE